VSTEDHGYVSTSSCKQLDFVLTGGLCEILPAKGGPYFPSWAAGQHVRAVIFRVSPRVA
jgi:hypothetical protein